MSNDVTIRIATIDDYSAICQLLGELDRQHVAIRPDVFQPFDGPARSHEYVADFIDDDNAEIFLADVDSDIVGLASIRLKASPEALMFRPRQNAIMDNLIIDPCFRGKGIGKRLLARTIEWTKARKMPSLEINVWIENESGMSFFTANGFTPMCQRMELRIDECD